MPHGTETGAKRSNQVLAVEVSPEERASKIPSAETVGAAVSILQRDGIVVIKQVVDHEAIDILNAKLTAEVEDMVAQPGTHFNFNKEARNISQPPPYNPDFMYDTIWANPWTASVVSAILGPHPIVHYANGNTALKSTERQTVHADLAFRHLRFPFGIVANFYLCDTSPANGSTEVWIGSHRDTSFEDHVKSADAEGGFSSIEPELVEARRKLIPPVQPVVQKGDLVLRDTRLWHAGMPNRTDTPRIMLAFSHSPWWYKNGMKMVLLVAAKPLVEKWKAESGIGYAAEFVEEDEPKPVFKLGSGSQNAAIVYD